MLINNQYIRCTMATDVTSQFVCERCGHDAKTKGNLIQHLGKIKECSTSFSEKKREDIIASLTKPKKEKIHQCNFCDLMFSTHQGKHQHGAICPKNPQNELKARVSELEKRVAQLTQELDDAKKAQHKQVANTGNKKSKKSIKPRVRREVWNTYIGEDVAVSKCMCCEDVKITQHQYICGHVVADCNGGTLEIDNLRPICAVCNDAMGHENMADYKLARFGRVLK